MSSARVDRAHPPLPAGRTDLAPGSPRWSTPLGWAFAALLLLVYGVFAWREINSGLEFDESFNLTVALNLADGLGYSTNGAALGTGITPFDPNISTGPALLLPTAALWALSGSLEVTRLVPLAFFALYLVASGVLGKRIAGVPGALAAVASPLLLTVGIRDLVTWSLVPGRFVGEIAASALLLSAAVLLPSRRTPLVLLGGLCAGLAIQTKFNFLAAIGVLGLCWLVTDFRATRKVPFVRWAAAAVGVALPTAAFEAYRYRSLGDGYGANLRETKAFLDTQSQTPVREVVLDRSRALFELLSSPGLALLVLAVVVVLASLVGRQLAARRGNSTQAAALLDPGQRSLVAGVLLAALTLAAMWITISIQPSLRQGLPALLVALPALAALTARVLTAPAGADARPRTTSRLAAGVCGVALVLVVLGAGVQIARGSDSDALLVQQRAAAEVIERSGTPSLPVQGWWMLAEFQVLTDLPVANHPGAEPPTIKVFSPVRALIERGRPDSREFLDQCTEVLYAEWGALVCR